MLIVRKGTTVDYDDRSKDDTRKQKESQNPSTTKEQILRFNLIRTHHDLVTLHA